MNDAYEQREHAEPHEADVQQLRKRRQKRRSTTQRGRHNFEGRQLYRRIIFVFAVEYERGVTKLARRLATDAEPLQPNRTRAASSEATATGMTYLHKTCLVYIFNASVALARMKQRRVFFRPAA
jgi:hypothetical protein